MRSTGTSRCSFTVDEHCVGDGIKMGEAIDGKSIDLEWVQVHPTNLVKLNDLDVKQALCELAWLQ